MEINFLCKGFNFCLILLLLGKYDINKDIDVFVCRLIFKEYYILENLEEIIDDIGY